MTRQIPQRVFGVYYDHRGRGRDQSNNLQPARRDGYRHSENFSCVQNHLNGRYMFYLDLQSQTLVPRRLRDHFSAHPTWGLAKRLESSGKVTHSVISLLVGLCGRLRLSVLRDLANRRQLGVSGILSEPVTIIAL